jgi:hypothetical protein
MMVMIDGMTFHVEIYSWDIGRKNGIKLTGHMSDSP